MKWPTVRMDIVAPAVSLAMILGPGGYIGLEIVRLGSEDERDGEDG